MLTRKPDVWVVISAMVYGVFVIILLVVVLVKGMHCD